MEWIPRHYTPWDPSRDKHWLPPDDERRGRTLYTVMKLAQNICNTTGQCESVFTFDLALYAKAKQLQMKYPEEFKNTVIRMGGFHIALNYLSLLGRKYANSGLDDLLIESGVYAAGTTSVLMLGKSYNRGIRAHKLVMEALFRH